MVMRAQAHRPVKPNYAQRMLTTEPLRLPPMTVQVRRRARAALTCQPGVNARNATGKVIDTMGQRDWSYGLFGWCALSRGRELC